MLIQVVYVVIGTNSVEHVEIEVFDEETDAVEYRDQLILFCTFRSVTLVRKEVK